MIPFIFVRVIWTAHHIAFPLKLAGANMRELRVQPEPAHPFGRKGLALEAGWKQLAQADTAGLLLLDGDVVIDPHDLLMMLAALHTEPAAVHVAPVKLWPVSKNDLEGWAWGHWRDGKPGQELCDDPDFFSFNFTYLPAALMTKCVKAGLKSWQFPHVDRNVSRVARESGTPIRVVKDCHPKHMHY